MPPPRQCNRCGRSFNADNEEPLCADCRAAPENLGPTPIGPSTDAASIPPNLDALVGQRIRYLGDYELLKELGRGGMGVVFKAHQTSLDRTVAVKMILGGQLADAAEFKRLRDEAQLAAQLQHPNVVTVHEVGEYEGHQYFSMDYVDGPNLATRIKHGNLGIAEAVNWIQQIAAGVAHAHEHGIVHRDLKPLNVLIEQSSGLARVTDFGLARRLAPDVEISSPGAGTACYMAPEQALRRADRIGFHTDVYGIGAILYEMLTRRPPFLGHGEELFRSIRLDPPTPPSKLNPLVPPRLEAICLKCLQKAPSQRYESCAAFIDDIRRFSAGQLPKAQPPSPLEQSWQWLRSHRILAAPVLTFMFVSLIWTVYGLLVQLRWEQAHQNTPPQLSLLARQLQTAHTGNLWLFMGMGLTSPYFLSALQQLRYRRLLSGKRPRTASFVVAGLSYLLLALFYLVVGAIAVELRLWQHNPAVRAANVSPTTNTKPATPPEPTPPPSNLRGLEGWKHSLENITRSLNNSKTSTDALMVRIDTTGYILIGMLGVILTVTVGLPETVREASFVMYRTREEEEHAITEARQLAKQAQAYPRTSPKRLLVAALIGVLVLISIFIAVWFG